MKKVTALRPFGVTIEGCIEVMGGRATWTQEITLGPFATEDDATKWQQEFSIIEQSFSLGAVSPRDTEMLLAWSKRTKLSEFARVSVFTIAVTMLHAKERTGEGLVPVAVPVVIAGNLPAIMTAWVSSVADTLHLHFETIQEGN